LYDHHPAQEPRPGGEGRGEVAAGARPLVGGAGQEEAGEGGHHRPESQF